MADHHNKYNNNNKVINIARIIKIWHRICYQSLSLATAFLPWSFHLLYITSIFPFHSFSSYGYICFQVSKCCWKNGANILACHGVAINFQFLKTALSVKHNTEKCAYICSPVGLLDLSMSSSWARTAPHSSLGDKTSAQKIFTSHSGSQGRDLMESSNFSLVAVSTLSWKQ